MKKCEGDMYLIGIDIGGTNIKYGLFEDNKLIFKDSTSTNTSDVVSQLQEIITNVIKSYNISSNTLERIGIGCPGLISKGIVLASANINLTNCNLQKIIADKFNCNVIVKNDVDMATLTEINLGDGKGVDNLVMLTVGTGIGGSIVINGKIYEGNGAGEFGHITFVRNGSLCGCGRHGCVEKYLSAIALSSRAKEMIKGKSTILLDEDIIKASSIEEALNKNDKIATEIVQNYADDFSEYLLDICNLLRPDRILIGGGLSYAPVIIDKIAHLCKIKGFGYPNAPQTDIGIAKFGNDAGIYGVLFAK